MQDESARDELVMELVSLAPQQSPETRESFLRSACGADAGLFLEVEDRVQWEERMSGFLTQSVVATLELLERPFEPGELVAAASACSLRSAAAVWASYTRRMTRNWSGAWR